VVQRVVSAFDVLTILVTTTGRRRVASWRVVDPSLLHGRTGCMLLEGEIFVSKLLLGPVTIDLTIYIDGIRQEEYVSGIKAAQISYADEYCETLASRLQVRDFRCDIVVFLLTDLSLTALLSCDSLFRHRRIMPRSWTSRWSSHSHRFSSSSRSSATCPCS
jgi:hypothetical protein